MVIFKTVKKIISKEGVLHFKRFAILECRFFAIYIHHIYKRDEDKHLHNHPWDYTSIVLKGTFTELGQVGLNGLASTRFLSAGDISRQRRERFHKILMLYSKKVVTLFFTGSRTRDDWGYNVDGTFVDHRTYREKKTKRDTPTLRSRELGRMASTPPR